MPYITGQDLKREVLQAGGEALSGSKWDTRVMGFINRSYRSLCAGVSEFLPERIEKWWWLRDSAILTILPVIELGTVSVVEGSASITFTNGPALDVDGYRFKVDTHPDWFKIAAHTAAGTSATLDSVYTGPTDTAALFKLMKVEYALDSAVDDVIAPMLGYRNNHRIEGLSPERMDDLWPPSSLQAGAPTHFALEGKQLVRFNRGGRDDGTSMRIEYRYRPVVTDLTDSSGSIPLVPEEYRAVIADMATAQILREKNDSRDQSYAVSAQQMLLAMVRKNRSVIPQMGDYMGHVFPRQGGKYGIPGHDGGPLRTESGLIIG